MSLIEREYMNRDRSHKSSHHVKKHHDQDRVRAYTNPAVCEVIYADEWDGHQSEEKPQQAIKRSAKVIIFATIGLIISSLIIGILGLLIVLLICLIFKMDFFLVITLIGKYFCYISLALIALCAIFLISITVVDFIYCL